MNNRQVSLSPARNTVVRIRIICSRSLAVSIASGKFSLRLTSAIA